MNRRETIDAWLAAGGAVLAASERAARAVLSEHDAARRGEGRTAWRTPEVFAWDGWVRQQWLVRNTAGEMPLNELQERALWLRTIQQSGQAPGRATRRAANREIQHAGRLAEAAMRAYRLLCLHAPASLAAARRIGWTGDPAEFSAWIEDFESRCRREAVVSESRLGLELTEKLRAGPAEARQALLLVGFDRILETQRELLELWGSWRLDGPGQAATDSRFWAVADSASETRACMGWLRERLRAEPEARLMVVATGLEARRGELERELLAADLDYEFSMGLPLGQMGVARSAVLLLRWFSAPMTEFELDWLSGSGLVARSAEEEWSVTRAIRQIRRNGHQRPEWPLPEFAQEAGGDFSQRLLAASQTLLQQPEQQSPLEWVAVAGRLLEELGWPGHRPLASLGFQARERFERVLEQCGSLGFDGSRMQWSEFTQTVAVAVAGTVFAAESHDAAIQITGPFEAAGQHAGAIWFLGADELSWPGRGEPHPLLPAGLQRETAMPHASPEADWALAEQATTRIVTSAAAVVFSYSRVTAKAEARPSRLVLERAGAPRELPGGEDKPVRDQTGRFAESAWIPFPHRQIRGGAAVLRSQSLCPFQAFGIARLATEPWELAEAGLNPPQRGLLLHAVLHRIWGGAETGGIRSLEELQAIRAQEELRELVGRIVAGVMAESFDPTRRASLPNRFPARYLQLEAERLTGLVTEWLEYERERLPFCVEETEAAREVTVAGLGMRLRLDRLDRLANGEYLVVDYKTGLNSPAAWEGERPDDVQLPLYAAFAVEDARQRLIQGPVQGQAQGLVQGLVFARLRAGDTAFYGRVRDASETLLPGLSKSAALVKNPLTAADLDLWRERIEGLGRDFLAGRATVDPKEPGKTCQRCHLHAVCRIYEGGTYLANEDQAAGETDD